MNDGKLCQEFDFDRIWYEGVKICAERDGVIVTCDDHPGWDSSTLCEMLNETLAKAGAPAKPDRVRCWEDCDVQCRQSTGRDL